MTPQAFLKLSDDELRAAGLSQGKVRTLRAAERGDRRAASTSTRLRTRLRREVHEALTALPGIGPWSADIYLLFCLGRADAFAAGDLALQIAARAAICRSMTRPSRDELFAIAERWRPWRGVAAHLLWAYYKVADRSRADPEKCLDLRGLSVPRPQRPPAAAGGCFTELICAASIPAERRGERDSRQRTDRTPITWMRTRPFRTAFRHSS